MALQGTLKDFGIADILQLIGQQQKTGMLHLKSKDHLVTVAFKNGDIVRAETTTRKKKDLIGSMLVRAELISEAQLVEALETQQRTLKRLGDVLVNGKYITEERFRKMVQLQATETLYGLFSWKSGTYQFEQTAVEDDPDGMTPLRAESVLMEGFRMVDEWPVIRRTINGYDLVFERIKDLPPPVAQADDVDAAFDEFAEKKKDENQGEFKSISDTERTIHGLLAPGRDVRKLIDLSCLGEFETCKGLLNLLNLGYAKVLPGTGHSSRSERTGTFLDRAGSAAGRVMLTLLLLAALAYLATRADLSAMQFSGSPTSTYADPAAQAFIARSQVRRLEAAVDLYRMERGDVPERLEQLVEAGLLGREDLRYPWRDPYYYRRVAHREFILLPPLR